MPMQVSKLIRQLKKKPRKLRHNVAKELSLIVNKSANERSNKRAIRALIKMADGGRRKWFSRYDLADQCCAIEALAETGSKEALDYLKRLIWFEAERINYSSHWSVWQKVRYIFPNAKGKS